MDGDKLGGPYKHHAYIGFSPKDKTAVQHLQAKLQMHGLICCLRSNKEDIMKSITDGVSASLKCVIFLTSDYTNDRWSKIETEEMINKKSLFSSDALLALKTDPAIEIPDSMKRFNVSSPNLDDETYIASLVAELKREPAIQLALVPKENIGYGSALGYFYGYLRHVIPGFKKCLLKTLQNEPDLLANTVKKMLIIIPESCYCPPSIDIRGKIETTNRYVVQVANRAGCKKRDFKCSLFKLTYTEKQNYYFAGELATPLLTLYDIHHHQLCGMTKHQLYEERDHFYLALKAIFSHPDNGQCNDQFKILYWSDPKTQKPNQQDIYDFLLPVLKKELDLERENERNASKYPATTYPAPVSKPETFQEQSDTFEAVESHGYNPSSFYETVGHYSMNQRPRGKCLIINIIKFDNAHLRERTGGEKDIEILTKLFEDLHFEVEGHNDVNGSTLENLLAKMNSCDHSKYDAFVCCFLTHGKLGVLYTSDGKQVEILEIVDYFSQGKCPSLRGKPKLFFIQACQDGSSNSEDNPNQSEDNSNQLSRNESLEQDASPELTMTTLDDESPTKFKHEAVLIPGEPDFLMSYSTLPGSVSYRLEETGSLYIHALEKWLRQGEEIDRALKQVTNTVKEQLEILDGQRGIMSQHPFHLTSGMDRLIYL